jgi:DNA end-binding protein Ku
MRPYHNGIILHTLYYPAEVREIAEYGKTENANLQKPEIDLAEQFIQQLTAKFEPEQYKDEYQQRVLEMIETKRDGQVVAGQAPKPKLAPVIDLMDALKKSIAERGAAPAAPVTAPTLMEPAKKKAPKSAPAAEAKPARGRKTG